MPKKLPEQKALQEQARKLYVEKRGTFEECAAILGCARETVRRMAEAEGWKTERAKLHGPDIDSLDPKQSTRGDYQAQKTLNQAEALQTLDARKQAELDLKELQKLSVSEQAEGYKARLGRALLKLPFIVELMHPLDLLKNAQAIDKLDQVACRVYGIGQQQGGTSLVQINLSSSPKAVDGTEVTLDSPSVD